MRDELLIQELIAGREEAFTALYEHYGHRLFKAAWDILGRGEDAEDAVQDVFVSLVRARPALAEVRNLNAYLFAALRRAALKRMEQRKDMQHLALESLEHELPAAQAKIASAEEERLHGALRSLPLEQREALVLKIDGGLTFEELAAALDISANTAASRYRYALEKLRTALATRESNANG